MIEAVLAMFASRHEPAATLTVRQTARAGRPVAGSTRWCANPSSVAHVRTVVLEVASPPDSSVIHCPGTSTSERWSSVTRTRQPPFGGGPDRAMSPPKEAAPAAAGGAPGGLGGAIGRQCLCRSTQVEAHAASEADRASL